MNYKGLAMLAVKRSRNSKWLFFAVAVTVIFGFGGILTFSSAKEWKVTPPFNTKRAFANLSELCKLGPRYSGSPGMIRQQELLSEYFSKLGGEVTFQEFTVRHPETGKPLVMKNLIAKWNPKQTHRVLLCAHYDTRPFPDRDPKNPKGIFVGANDGASGVAALQEIAHALNQMPPTLGVDFVLFDGEELIYSEPRDSGLYFLGSKYFAENYAADTQGVRYRAGILLDMVGDKDLQLFYETNSYNFARELTRDIWKVAAELNVREFTPRTRHEIRDDHLALNQIAKIPTVDLIDFDYPRPGNHVQNYWHTTMDTPDKCSGESICKVAHVVFEWIQRQK
jgi:glutaminyl-peptide cyclotransferase